MKHPYVLLDEMLHEAHQVQKLVQEQAEALAAVPAHRTVYSTPSLLLGLHTPTLLLGIHYSGAFKKGRKLKSPGQRKDYPSYDSDAEGNLLRITHHNGSLPYTHYFYRRSGREWAVPLFRSETSDQYCFYPYYTFFAEYVAVLGQVALLNERQHLIDDKINELLVAAFIFGGKCVCA